MQIFVSKDGQQFGPYTLEELHGYVWQGSFTAADRACHDGQNWVTIGQVPSFSAGGQTVEIEPNNKIRLWSSIGVGVALLVAGLLVWQFSGEDSSEAEQEVIASNDEKASGPGQTQKPSGTDDAKVENSISMKKVMTESLKSEGEEQMPNHPILKKLKSIKIPTVQFFESPLPETMAELQRLAKQFDFAEPDPTKKGVNIVVLNTAGHPPPNVTITLGSVNGMALDKMIGFITEQQGWTFDVRNDAVVLSRSGIGAVRPIGLETEFHEVPQGTIQRMTGGGGASGAGGADPFAPRAAGDDVGAKIRGFLEQAGIPFKDARGHKFVFDGLQMIVTHERRFLNLIERILERLDKDSKKKN